ncbi:hypothetical protein Amsp01_065740 [Amycolatopsis sp. NBRC 101858]|nr:hypothetical protein Amsp01_065740 [Amycolatopsis sp. NBRC 101858]
MLEPDAPQHARVGEPGGAVQLPRRGAAGVDDDGDRLRGARRGAPLEQLVQQPPPVAAAGGFGREVDGRLDGVPVGGLRPPRRGERVAQDFRSGQDEERQGALADLRTPLVRGRRGGLEGDDRAGDVRREDGRDAFGVGLGGRPDSAIVDTVAIIEE